MAGVVNRRYHLACEPTRERLSQMRRIAAAHLRHWGLDLQVAPVCAALDELLRNVVEHAGADDGRCALELRWSGRQLTVSVSDRDPRLPRLHSASTGGLGRVAALSDSWGTCATEDGGKVVWFTRRVADAQRVPLPQPVPDALAPEEQPLPVPLPVPQEGGPAPAEQPLRAAAEAR
ncbi:MULTISPECIES: ATP-binding protein [unclassified Streptomyces]|uniref:ATP-binding protein n=1 Tax=Streptomyces evansiae TaxID=3075535 RepID=A0ABU2QXP5_9ACTN|nr:MULTISPECIES: ATP-binding protein [unclassified Streptomyces]MDT0408634.1 ATP-binding protein [Streptomyces sp. DSM 41979]SCD55768.1 Histidine kinase-like ATPase domain-containing protein [Streptomyces sp. TverLS-915]SCE59424.1 Histidine kinase-like ATPase domain-containing protein [Streptomyces sp. DfronAA-171]SCF15961.1 Histidine kinase-like ATPase domain-containing protein [Streptomyces sp. LcepLS]